MKFELLTTPFLGQFDEAVGSRQELQDEVQQMIKFIHPAIEAVENPDPGFTPTNYTNQTQPQDPTKVSALEYAENYRAKLEQQCLYQIKESQRVCFQNYSSLYLECVDRVYLVDDFCVKFKVEHYCSTKKASKYLSFVGSHSTRHPLAARD